MSRLNSSVQHYPPRNYLISSLGCMKSLCSQAPTPSPYDFPTVSVLYTQFSTSQCWNQQLQIQFQIMFNPHPCQLLLMTNQNLKSLKSLTPRLTTDVMPARLLYLVHCTGYDGTDEETSWILTSELVHASELVVDFHSAYPAKSGPLSSL